MNHRLLIALGAALLPLASGAAISYESGTYTQTFSNLDWNASEKRTAWANNSTLPGWSITSSTTATETQPVWSAYDDGGESPRQYANWLPGADNLSYIKVAQRLTYHYIDEENVRWREWDGNNRLGFRTGGTPSNCFVTVEFTNAAGYTLDTFTVAYQAAQFLAREANGAIDVRYSFNGSTWTTINGGGGAAGSANMRYLAPYGTAPGVNKVLIDSEVVSSIQDFSSTVTGISWANGTSLFIQFAFWRDVPGGSSGNAPVLTIDNVTFSASGEPPPLDQVSLEQSTDLQTWQPAEPGLYEISTTPRFFRVKTE